MLDRPSTVTVTSAGPAARAAVVAFRLALETNWTLVAATPPTVTVAPAAKLAPPMVISVPPAAGPVAGDTLNTVGPTVTGGSVGPAGVSEPPHAVIANPASTRPANAPRRIIVRGRPRDARGA